MQLSLYITPRASDLLVLPFHKCGATLDVEEQGDVELRVRLRSPVKSMTYRDVGRMLQSGAQLDDPKPASATLQSTEHELVASGPGFFTGTAEGVSQGRRIYGNQLPVRVRFGVAGIDEQIVLAFAFPPGQESGEYEVHWNRPRVLE